MNFLNDDEFFEWCDEYKKRKAQSAEKKEELLHVGWRPSRSWNWYMLKHDKKDRKLTK